MIEVISILFRVDIIACVPSYFILEMMEDELAWFLNRYDCDRCGTSWTDEWSCTCDDDCPKCGARHMSPSDSDDLTIVVEQDGDKFVVLRSPETAEHDPDYRELAYFSTRKLAEAFIATDQSPPY